MSEFQHRIIRAGESLSKIKSIWIFLSDTRQMRLKFAIQELVDWEKENVQTLLKSLDWGRISLSKDDVRSVRRYAVRIPYRPEIYRCVEINTDQNPSQRVYIQKIKTDLEKDIQLLYGAHHASELNLVHHIVGADDQVYSVDELDTMNRAVRM